MGNGTGIAGMILGIIACIFSIFPLLSLFGVILGVIALTFSLFSVKKNDIKALGYVGLVFSIIAIVICVYWLIVIITVITKANTT